MYEDKNIKITKRVKPKKIKEKKVKVKKTSSKRNKIHLSNIEPIFKNVNWKVVLIKLIILFAILTLIVFTISRIQNINKNDNNSKSTENYQENLSYLTDTLLNYYNLKKLPKKTNDSVSMIFQEMFDFNIIKEIKPNETENYDLRNSYIIITKENEDFKFKINLKWSNNELIFTQYITCTEKNCTLKK